jgi:hypothetical protein
MVHELVEVLALQAGREVGELEVLHLPHTHGEAAQVHCADLPRPSIVGAVGL